MILYLMDNETQAHAFLAWINKNYTEQKNKLMAFCHDKHYQWSEDIFCDTYLKIYDKILKGKLQDGTDKGFEGYFFISFKMNTIRDRQYARNQKRDANITDLFELYELYKNTELTHGEKLKSDLKKDFYTLYLLHAAERQFDAESFYLFKLKVFEKITYKELALKTGIKGVRQKVIAVKNYLRENVTKEEIDRAFNEIYGDLLTD